MKRLMRGASAAALLVFGACASRGAPDATEPAAARPPAQEPGAARADEAAVHQHVQPLPATGGAGYTEADVRFMQDMIGHHAQALVMAAMAPTHGAGERLLKLAQKIDISQKDEIAFMKQWLAERGQAIPDDAHVQHVMMPGMLTPEQLAQLDAARGREFERLFLTFMIGHHQGALQMVETLFASPGAAQDPEIFRFATDVDADQRDEIFVMERMLDMLTTNRGSDFR